MSERQHYEFANSAGPGTLLSYGVVDNQHSLRSYLLKDRLVHVAQGGFDGVDQRVAPCSPNCETGK